MGSCPWENSPEISLDQRPEGFYEPAVAVDVPGSASRRGNGERENERDAGALRESMSDTDLAPARFAATPSAFRLTGLCVQQC